MVPLPSWVRWTPELIERTKEILGRHETVGAAAIEVGELLGRPVNGNMIYQAFLSAKAGAPGSFTLGGARNPRTSPEFLEGHIPDGFVVTGATVETKDDDGSRKWTRYKADSEARLAQLMDAVASIAEPFKGLAKATERPAHADADLLTIYPMGDPHLGMYSWAEETGQNFDLEIAEQNLVAATDRLVGLAPSSEKALIANLGDFFHTDNASNRTARAGNALDVDGRWSKVLRVGIRTMRRCIDRALEKHASVRVINEIGNHDDHTSIVLGLCLEQFYENEPRVTIDTSPDAFHWVRFGKCLVGVTHGHMTKPQNLPGIMAADRPKDWGETKHRYWYTGHVHHDSLKEYPGCTVETFRTLAARDAWHNASGYRSGRDMKCDVLHVQYGRVNRHIVGVDQLMEAG